MSPWLLRTKMQPKLPPVHQTSVQGLSGFAADGGVQLTIRGSCMSPLINDGASVLVRSRRRYLPGDVIVFRTPAGDLAAHRLLGWRPAGLVTKGDHCSIHDAPVQRDAIVGAV